MRRLEQLEPLLLAHGRKSARKNQPGHSVVISSFYTKIKYSSYI
jgi:hypothetical protein